MLRIGSTWCLAVFLLSGCGGGESFDPSSATLSGSWLLSDETNPNAIPPGSGVTSNTCIMRNVPVTLDSTDADLWAGRTEDGGTLQCELNGTWAEPTLYNPNLFLLVTKTGGDLSIGLANGVVVYTGSLVADNRMDGTVTGELNGRVGTWSGRRN